MLLVDIWEMSGGPLRGQGRVHVLVCLLILTLQASAALAATLHVDDDNKTGTITGTSKHPHATIGAAIGEARSGDTILVARGTYTENITISDKTITLLGGAAGGSSADYKSGKGGRFAVLKPIPNITRIKGTGAKKPTVTLSEAGNTRVDGFVISGGRGKKEGKMAYGGGIHCSGGSPTISNNVIENNDTRYTRESMGGGIYATDARVTISGNVIRNNYSYGGAGVCINEGTAVIRKNTVRDNVAVGDHGGGLHLSGKNLEVADNLIINNEVGRKLQGSWGGGLLLHSKGSNAHLARNVVTGNYAKELGSGVFIDDGARALIENELIFANKCTKLGGAGLYVDGADHYSGGPVGSSVTIVNATVAGHRCGGRGNGIYVEYHSKVTIKNSIFWDNGGEDFWTKTRSSLRVTYTHSQQARGGAGNSTRDCLFASAGQGDYHLKSKKGRWDPAASGGEGGWVVDSQHSPCIDAGDPSSRHSSEPNPNGSRINLGAHGNTRRASLANMDGPAPAMETVRPPPDTSQTSPPPNNTTIKPSRQTTGPGPDINSGSGGSGRAGCCNNYSLRGGCTLGRGDSPLFFIAGLMLLLLLRRRSRHVD